MRSANDIKGAIFWNFIVHCLALSTYSHPFMLRKHRDGSRGGMLEVCTPTPWDDLHFSKISSILWKTTTTTNKQTKWDQVEVISAASPPGTHLMAPQSPLISWVNPFPSRFINRTIFFCNVLESHERAYCLLLDVRHYCHFSIFIGSFLYQSAKPPQGAVLFTNLLGKGLTSRACMGDEGLIWWAPPPPPLLRKILNLPLQHLIYSSILVVCLYNFTSF